MSEKDRIINNINATMSMEDMPLLEDDKERLKKCLDGELSYQDVIEELVKEFKLDTPSNK